MASSSSVIEFWTHTHVDAGVIAFIIELNMFEVEIQNSKISKFKNSKFKKFKIQKIQNSKNSKFKILKFKRFTLPKTVGFSETAPPVQNQPSLQLPEGAVSP